MAWNGFVAKMEGFEPFLEDKLSITVDATRMHACMRGYLCKKSLPIAHINWDNIEELIEEIGTERLKRLWKRKRD